MATELKLRVPSGSGELVVEMIHWQDRFVHEIGFENRWGYTPLLRSVEGDAATPWPPSSPLQEVVRESHGARDFLAGIGRAGKGHWSLIVAAMQDPIGIEFEFACRVTGKVGWLGSTYGLEAGLQTSSSESRVEVRSNQLVLACQPQPDSLVAYADGRIQCFPQLDLDPEKRLGPQTIRWAYQLQLREEHGENRQLSSSSG